MIEFTLTILSSAADERLFSAERDIYWHKRACLTEAHINELTFLQGNHHLALECCCFLYHALASLSQFHYCFFLYFSRLIFILVLNRFAVTNSLSITRFMQGKARIHAKRNDNFQILARKKGALKCSKNLHF